MSGKFTPEPVRVIETPEQIKAFTDPLRARVLRYLMEREATNQQVADAFGEPHAKVLYHIRFLLGVQLIQLVDTQIKGGNVEKYYRAVARMFDVRPHNLDDESDEAIAQSLLENLRHNVLTSRVTFPDSIIHVHNRSAWMKPERADEFLERLKLLLAEFFEVGEDDAPPGTVKMNVSAYLYRDALEKPND